MIGVGCQLGWLVSLMNLVSDSKFGSLPIALLRSDSWYDFRSSSFMVGA